MAYEHLRLEKESPVTDRHRPRGFGAPAPADPRGHGNALLRSFRAVRELAANEDLGGFDDLEFLSHAAFDRDTQVIYAPELDDLHDTGIFSWRYLYELGLNQAKIWAEYLKALEATGLSRDPRK